jgi:hypothetical protein
MIWTDLGGIWELMCLAAGCAAAPSGCGRCNRCAGEEVAPATWEVAGARVGAGKGGGDLGLVCSRPEVAAPPAWRPWRRRASKRATERSCARGRVTTSFIGDPRACQ